MAAEVGEWKESLKEEKEQEDKTAEDEAVDTNLEAQGEELGRETKMWSKQEEERKEKSSSGTLGERVSRWKDTTVSETHRKLRKVKMVSLQDEHLRGSRDSGLIERRVVKSTVGESKVYK